MRARGYWMPAKSGWVSLALCVATLPLHAADPMLEDRSLARSYGSGVHAYFANDYQRAYDDLTLVIEAGSGDPRAWYFRGLAASKLGRLDEAEADFATGAEREAAVVGDWPVSRSLERVQGHDRLALERHRIRARVVELQQRERTTSNRYSGIDSRQDVVRRRVRPEGVSGDPLGLFTEPAPAADPVEPIQRPVENEPPDEAAGTPKPVADQPAADGVRAEAEEPIGGELTAEEPVTEEPMAEAPEAEEPAADAEVEALEAEAVPAVDAPGDTVFGE
jgi:tetratricopeptide (TPR) repeat protein